MDRALPFHLKIAIFPEKIIKIIKNNVLYAILTPTSFTYGLILGI
jgi:hypothetical protein